MGRCRRASYSLRFKLYGLSRLFWSTCQHRALLRQLSWNPHARATAHKGFISRIVPSKVARTDSHLGNVAWVPSIVRTDDAIPSVVQLTGIHSENPLEGLITLMQVGAGHHRR